MNFCLSYGSMGFFSFFRKRKAGTRETAPGPVTPVGILQSLKDYIPELYKNRRPYIDYLEFLRHHEFGLALDSLIQLADESGHYFSEHFWLSLAACADKMGMRAEAEHCRQQIRRSEQEINFKISKGVTIEKIDDTHFQHHIAEIMREDWRNQRRKKDALEIMMQQDGFYFKSNGRSGTIYYIEDNKVMEIYYEVSGVPQYDILIYPDDIKKWTIPERLLSNDEYDIVRKQLVAWLKEKNIKSDLL